MKVWVAESTGQSQDPWLCGVVSEPGKGGKVNVQLDNGEVSIRMLLFRDFFVDMSGQVFWMVQFVN